VVGVVGTPETVACPVGVAVTTKVGCAVTLAVGAAVADGKLVGPTEPLASPPPPPQATSAALNSAANSVFFMSLKSLDTKKRHDPSHAR